MKMVVMAVEGLTVVGSDGSGHGDDDDDSGTPKSSQKDSSLVNMVLVYFVVTQFSENMQCL